LQFTVIGLAPQNMQVSSMLEVIPFFWGWCATDVAILVVSVSASWAIVHGDLLG
jgi:hypothetical protein